jgi:hypothetical protein
MPLFDVHCPAWRHLALPVHPAHSACRLRHGATADPAKGFL